MRRVSAGGLGALAFLVLVIVATAVASPPGGTYKASDVATYLTRGHRPAVIASLYLMGLAAVALLFLLRRLRDALQGQRAAVFWGLSIAGAAAIVAGFALITAVPIAMGVGGKGVVIAPTVAFTIIETGWAVFAGAGFLLVGLALLTLTLGPSVLPAWVRWTTLVGGLGFAAGLAWFPLPIVGIWLVLIGVWLLRSERSGASATSAVAAA